MARQIRVTVGTTSPARVVSPYLPWDRASRAVMAAAPGLSHAHEYVSFPRTTNNADPTSSSDYIKREWMPPGDLEGSTDHRVYGGLIRDREITRPPLGGSNWSAVDRAWELQQCVEMGLDAVSTNIMQRPGNQRWTQMLDVYDGGHLLTDPYLKNILMPDGTTSATGGGATATESAQMLADNLATVAHDPFTKWITDPSDGVSKMLIFPYHANRAPNGAGVGGSGNLAFWTTVRDRLANTHGIPCLFWFLLQVGGNWWDAANAPALNSIAYGFARGGDRDAGVIAQATNSNANAAAYCHATFGKPWSHPIATQDFRPSSGAYWEAWGTMAMQNSWDAAWAGGGVNKADSTNIITLNDFSESSCSIGSEGSGYCWMDLHSYWNERQKLGSFPPIVRDGIYITHRRHNTSLTTFTSTFQTLFATKQSSVTATKNEIELRVFLTAPAQVEIRVNGTVAAAVGGGVAAWSAPAGMSVYRAVLANGTATGHVIRGGSEVSTVTSETPISSTQQVQDLVYYVSSSLRQGT